MVSSLDDVWPMVQCFGKKWIGHSQDDLGTRETRIQHLHIHTHTHMYMYMYILHCTGMTVHVYIHKYVHTMVTQMAHGVCVLVV